MKRWMIALAAQWLAVGVPLAAAAVPQGMATQAPSAAAPGPSARVAAAAPSVPSVPSAAAAAPAEAPKRKGGAPKGAAGAPKSQADTVHEPMFEAANGDNRVERIVYSDSRVTKIGAIVGQPFLIEFGDDEAIDDVAGGSISGWDVHKRGTRLFVLAKKESTFTTLLVTTPKHSYVFDLIPKAATPANMAQRPSKIVFSYPPPPPSRSALNSLLASLPPAPAAPPAPPPPPAYRNDNYSLQVVSQQEDIRPTEVFDDGRFTWFRFPNNLEMPAIYKSAPGSQEEMLVNRHVEGDYVVLHATAPLWNLRLAKSLVGVFNDSYDAQGQAPLNGTTVPGLAREGKQ